MCYRLTVWWAVEGLLQGNRLSFPDGALLRVVLRLVPLQTCARQQSAVSVQEYTQAAVRFKMDNILLHQVPYEDQPMVRRMQLCLVLMARLLAAIRVVYVHWAAATSL